MARYNCMKCGHIWDDKGFPSKCPNCDSRDIKTAKNVKSIVWYILGGVFVVVLFFVMLKGCGSGDIELLLTTNETKDVEIKITNLSKSDFKKHRIVVYKDAEGECFFVKFPESS